MTKEIFISSRRLNNKCIYAITIVGSNISTTVNHFHLQEPIKACLYATDLVELNHKDQEPKVYHFETDVITNYVKSLRNLNIGKRKEFFDLNLDKIKEYIDTKYPIYQQLPKQELEK